MTMPELARWDAVETRDAIRRGDVRADEVLEAAIERAEACRHLGAIVTPCYERARSTLHDGPLGGVPTFVKDLVQLEGVATAWGSRASGDYVSPKSEVIAQRLEDCGLVALGKSATPELGLTTTTEPLRTGPCRNPYASLRSCGGSSGGAAVLVATGAVPIAHASDGGGSIRIPASCCGLVGLKPSRHRLDMPASTMLPVNVACDGVLSRTVRDTVAFYDAIERQRPSRRLSPIGEVKSEPGRKLRMGIFVEAPAGTPVHDDNRAAAREAGALCETLGHQVEEIACPFDGGVMDDFLRYWTFLAWGQTFSGKVLLHRGWNNDELEPFAKGLRAAFAREPAAVAKATWRLRGFGAAYARVLERYDVLICPTLASPPPRLGFLSTDVEYETVFARLREYAAFTPLQNTSGAPAISLPLGKSSEGLPIGVQFAAAWGEDRLLLELARSIEQAQPWPLVAPRESWER